MRPIFVWLLLGLLANAYANQSVYTYHNPNSDESIFLAKQDVDKFSQKAQKYYHKQYLVGKPNVYIGMTADDVKHNSNWGEPSEISTLINQFGKQEIWIYGNWDKILHFTNGKVTHIQY